jgi:hypothetical protein
MDVVAPTQALAEDAGPALSRSVRVLPLGACGLRRHDLRKREAGPEELRPLLWPQVPYVDRLYGLLAAGMSAHALAAVAAMFSQLADQPDWHLLVFGLEQLELFTVANGLEGRVTAAAMPVADQLPFVLNALDLLVCPPWTEGHWAIELAMACGCLPIVVDDQLWASRVDQGRGVELPCFHVPGEQPDVVFDPTGGAQVLRLVDRSEVFRRRVNCAAWAKAVDSQPETLNRAWADILT